MEAGHQFSRRLHRGLEVGRGEGHFSGGHAGDRAVGEVGSVHQERFVQVGTDTDVLALLPKVHRLVLVAQKGEGYLLGGAGQFRQRCGNGIEVLHRRQRDGHVGHTANLGRPDAGGGDNEVGLDLAMGGMHGGDAPAGDAEAGDFGAAEKFGAGLLGRARHRLCRPGRLRLEVGGDVERAKDAVGQEWEAGVRLVRAEQVAIHAPGEAVAVLAFQVGETFGRPGDFHAADLAGAGLTVHLHVGPEIDCVARELGHGFGGVDLKNEAGGMRS